MKIRLYKKEIPKHLLKYFKPVDPYPNSGQFRLRNQIIWYKPNHIPSSAKDRFAGAYEPVFMLVKKIRYWFDLEEVRELSEKSLQKNDVPEGDGLSPKYETIFQNEDVEKWKWMTPKYRRGKGHSNRQGLDRPLNTVTIKAYKDYQEPIAKFLKKHIKSSHKPILDKTFGKHKWRHWIRTDLSGAALPCVEDWFKLKEILRFDDTFDDKIYEVQKLNIPIFRSGRNPGDVWAIPTQPFSARKLGFKSIDHYATFPEELVRRCILCGCPQWICKKCGKARVRITKTEQEIDKWDDKYWWDFLHRTSHSNRFYKRAFEIMKKWMIESNCYDYETFYKWWLEQKKGKWASGNLQKGQGNKFNRELPFPRPEKRLSTHTVGWTDCGCNAGWEAGVVLDPFMGSGTTLKVAEELNRKWIGIDMNPKYCRMAVKRVSEVIEMNKQKPKYKELFNENGN